jgi:branched-chain amino acid transport system ATP-binding protein
LTAVAAPLLEVDAIVAGYGHARILQGLSLRVARGGITVLLGANGAGKTTLMKTVAGLLPASSGRIRFDGRPVDDLASDRRVVAGMVLVPEGRMVFPALSVLDNLRLGGINPRARPRWRRNVERVFALFPRLSERSTQAAGTLSGGEQQMLAIGRGLMAEPTLMLLDEPTLGLAPVMASQMFALMERLVDDGLTVLLAEQDVERSLQVADHACVIENGRVVLDGPAVAVAGDPRIREAYLGL